jgi:hypothetical protein
MSENIIPDIRKDPKAWFGYFNPNNKPGLSKPEILQSVLDTLNATTGNIPDIENLIESIDNIWLLCNLDQNEEVTYEKFQMEGGLCESIVSSLPPISPENITITTASTAATAATAATATVSAVSAINAVSNTPRVLPLETDVRVQCGRCNARVMFFYFYILFYFFYINYIHFIFLLKKKSNSIC